MDEAICTVAPEEVRTCFLHAQRGYYQLKAGGRPVSKVSASYLEKLDTPSQQNGLTFWEEAARYCHAGVLDPDRLVQAFFLLQASKSFLEPARKLLSKEVLQKYQELSPTQKSLADQLAAQQHELQVACDTHALVNGIPSEVMIRTALSSPRTSYCPLFRYCQLTRAGLDELAQEWLVPAARQYLAFWDRYDAAWGAFLPPALRQLAQHHLSRRTA